MKHNFFTRSIHFLMILIFAASCSKDKVYTTTCNPCITDTAQSHNVFTVNDDNWTKASPRTYQSDLHQVLEKYVGSYNSITSVSLISYISGDNSTGAGAQELTAGNTISLANGDLTFTGSLLIFNVKILNGQPPVLPFSSLLLKITVK